MSNRRLGSADPIAEDRWLTEPAVEPSWGVGLAVLGLILAAFALVGEGDYADAVTAERDALRVQLAQCGAAAVDAPSPRPSPSRGEGESQGVQ